MCGSLLKLSFNPYFNGYSILTESRKRDIFNFDTEGFNPYFNGYSILTLKSFKSYIHNYNSFNPYFNGYSILTLYRQHVYRVKN